MPYKPAPSRMSPVGSKMFQAPQLDIASPFCRNRCQSKEGGSWYHPVAFFFAAPPSFAFPPLGSVSGPRVSAFFARLALSCVAAAPCDVFAQPGGVNTPKPQGFGSRPAPFLCLLSNHKNPLHIG